MSRTVSELKNSVAAQISGLDLNQVEDLYHCFERAARIFVQKAKIPETLGIQNLTVYDRVTDYLINTSIFGTNIIDIRPQGISRQQNDFVFKKFQDDFDRNKNWIWQGTQATFTYNAGTPIIRIATSHVKPAMIIDTMNDSTGWTGSGDANNLQTDNSFYYQQPGSISFDLDGSTTQGILSKTISSFNFSSISNPTGFLAIEVPNSTVITSIGVRLGSDSSNYIEIVNTATTLGAFISGEWMLIPFNSTITPTIVGSPDLTSVTYIAVVINYNGTAQTTLRIGNLFLSQPTPMQALYMTAGFFSVGGVVSNSITTDADLIILNDSAYTIYEKECALAVLKQQGGAGVDSTMPDIEQELNGSIVRNGVKTQLGLYDMYKAENPSEILRTSGSWYDNNQSYSNDGVI